MDAKGRLSISAQALYSRLGKELAPIIVDVRRSPAFAADGTLEQGITGWAELGLPRRRKLAVGSDGWVTRERPKIERIACPWLIRRLIEPEARFLFAPTERVFAVAAETGATAYQIPDLRRRSRDAGAQMTSMTPYTPGAATVATGGTIGTRRRWRRRSKEEK